MKVCVLNGSPRKHKTTYDVYKKVEDALRQQGDIEITEFNAVRDFPTNCVGCYTCLTKTGEKDCPHIDKVEPIKNAIDECDVLVLLSPVYCLSVTGYMKALLDHFAYRFHVHRPHPSMRTKSALVIAVAAGNGMAGTNKLMADNVKSWGIPKVLKMQLGLFAKSFDDMPEGKKKKVTRQAKRVAKKLHRNVKNKDKQSYPLKFKFLKSVMKSTIKKYGEGHLDYDYWNKMGWL